MRRRRHPHPVVPRSHRERHRRRPRRGLAAAHRTVEAAEEYLAALRAQREGLDVNTFATLQERERLQAEIARYHAALNALRAALDAAADPHRLLVTCGTAIEVALVPDRDVNRRRLRDLLHLMRSEMDAIPKREMLAWR
jgi:hypothetical protein